MTFRQSIYFILGVVNVGLGTAGIFLPLLPTTPFLLLAAFLFARSNDRWHRWLLSHPRLGPYIHAFRSKTGLTRSQKLRIGASITVIMWVSVYFAPLPWIRAMLIVMWVFWTLLLVFVVKTAREFPRPPTELSDGSTERWLGEGMRRDSRETGPGRHSARAETL
jgi:uncharacterized membrane protein YbaN (DUF454 family)